MKKDHDEDLAPTAVPGCDCLDSGLHASRGGARTARDPNTGRDLVD